jgi:ABC-type multidrug transport system fused ATPase/permease subunit
MKGTNTAKKENRKTEKEAEALNSKNFWKEFWQLLSSFRRYFWLLLLLSLFSVALGILKPFILKLLIDGFNSFSTKELLDIVKLIILYLGSDQLRSLVAYFFDKKLLRLMVEADYFLNMRAQEKLIFLSLGYHEKEDTGAKVIKVARGIDRISNFLDSVFHEFIPTFLQMFFTIIVLFLTDWRIGSSILFFTPIFLWVTYYSNRRMHPLRKQIFIDYEKANGKMVQSILNINAVQSFVQEKKELSAYDKIRTHIRDNENKQWGWLMKIGLGRNLIVDVGRATVLFLGAYLVFQGNISVGSLIFAFSLSEAAYGSLYRLSRFYDRMEDGREGINRLLALLKDEDPLKTKAGGLKPKNVVGALEFINTSFYYNENSRPALADLNFKIIPGSITALIGPSGGGKTTVARLIYRHYDPTSGQVLLDGRDLRDYDLAGFRKFLAIVPQEVEIFDLTVAENIAYACPRASLDEIKAAAKIANADVFISRLDKGYETLVGERGIKLSGGQRQRIGIARAVLTNPRILIFDEATSNLDSESERLIQEAIKKISRGRTMIIIAHRLSTIRQADKIVVLEKGRVVESGSHVELANAKGGLYAKLLKLQAMGDVK